MANDKLKVLILEPNADQLYMMTQMLRSHFTITPASTTTIAKDIVVSNQVIDLITTALMMPEENGFDFIRFVRQIKRHSQTPIICISASLNILNYDQPRQVGCSKCLAKPYKSEQLIDSIYQLTNTVP